MTSTCSRYALVVAAIEQLRSHHDDCALSIVGPAEHCHLLLHHQRPDWHHRYVRHLIAPHLHAMLLFFSSLSCQLLSAPAQQLTMPSSHAGSFGVAWNNGDTRCSPFLTASVAKPVSLQIQLFIKMFLFVGSCSHLRPALQQVARSRRCGVGSLCPS